MHVNGPELAAAAKVFYKVFYNVFYKVFYIERPPLATCPTVHEFTHLQVGLIPNRLVACHKDNRFSAASDSSYKLGASVELRFD